MKKCSIFIFSMLLATTVIAQETPGKTGWNFGVLPAVTFDTDLGFQYGGLINLFDYGDGKIFPNYYNMFYVEASHYTKGSSIFRIMYDSDYLLKGIIQIAPLAFMRGRTLDHAFVILDEAQNTTHNQMKMFLTRMGKNAKFMITGDPGQVDLPRRTISGLKEAILVLKDIEGIGIIYLDDKDIVRHRLVKKVIDAYKSIENLD